jgi:nitrite reductase/ring-hydroxylating ferredoxin subunit
MGEGYEKVGQVSDFPVGSMKKVTLWGQDVLLANSGGTIFAIGNKCTHRGGPLNEGELEGTTVTCPWHGGQFDVSSGKVLAPPPMKDEQAYQVRIEGDDVLVKKP